MYIPLTATTREIQQKYRRIFELAKQSGPVIVMTRNKPDVVILSIADFEQLSDGVQPENIKGTVANLQSHHHRNRKRILLGAALMSDL